MTWRNIEYTNSLIAPAHPPDAPAHCPFTSAFPLLMFPTTLDGRSFILIYALGASFLDFSRVASCTAATAVQPTSWLA
jgi:hypothetical protein